VPELALIAHPPVAHRYLTYIPRTGPTGREQNADLCRLPVGATETCSAGITRAKTMPPENAPLEQAGSEFSLAASEIDRLIDEMDTYYESKLFKDDKWAKGKAMHPRLMAAWDRFSTADRNLHDTLDGITKPLAQRVLARLEREAGKKFRYHRKKVLITARELVESSDPIGEDDDIDFARFSNPYTEFDKALDDLMTYGSMNKAELNQQQTAPNWPRAASNYDAFVKDAGDFKKAAKEFWRCLRDAPEKAKLLAGLSCIFRELEPQRTPRRSWSRSIERNSAEKFPSPNERWFSRWMSSKKLGPMTFLVKIWRR
jgi:hypothetical protein